MAQDFNVYFLVFWILFNLLNTFESFPFFFKKNQLKTKIQKSQNLKPKNKKLKTKN